ncbi:flavin reductase family protein [Streptomyces sp. DSM 44915]|uniref:Flavin reductase family protein n=1 Tax=Streptomyces chisholmiae TaxID=3075540 RepID=A0ABU2JWS0_9ACTN|nr:flavin reductase family protein [Streptomyces sp. DSM 44915]MDT0268673.1 flavin reductase family protein [Streptomyces sp. DSM 44915]
MTLTAETRLPAAGRPGTGPPSHGAGQPRTGGAPFADVMAALASGVAVVTTGHPDLTPHGLLVSSLCSYSADPPSLLVSVAETSRSYPALTEGAAFGVHLLGRGDAALAALFAGRGDKFARLAWSWDGTVPRLAGHRAYLRCARAATFQHGDHAVVIGEVVHCEPDHDEPLVYYRRRLGWQLTDPPPPVS